MAGEFLGSMVAHLGLREVGGNGILSGMWVVVVNSGGA